MACDGSLTKIEAAVAAYGRCVPRAGSMQSEVVFSYVVEQSTRYNVCMFG